MKGTFGEGLDKLSESVGVGRLKGSVKVNQVYAHYQHAHPEFHHPDGGKAYYLRDPLFANVDLYMHRLASKAITEEGSDLIEVMSHNMEHLSTEGVYVQAPWEFADLRASGHPKVESDGAVVYDRAPHMHRLSSEEIRIKNRLSRLLDPGRYKR